LALDGHDRLCYIHRNPTPHLRRREEWCGPYVLQFTRKAAWLTGPGPSLEFAHVMENDDSGHSYVHYLNTDKRLDEWVLDELVRPATEHEARAATTGPSTPTTNGIQTRKRKRGSDTAQPPPNTRRVSNTANAQPDTVKEENTPNGAETQPTQPRELTEDEYDIQQHRKLFSKRNFDKVVFGHWQIKTWCVLGYVLLSYLVHLGLFVCLEHRVFRYFSPYPVTESESSDAASSTTPRGVSTPSGSSQKLPGVARTSVRAHGRTSDLLAGGLNRSHSRLEQSVLWVCDRCFKYMTDGTLWEVHSVRAIITASLGFFEIEL
jgi:histone acetyltransferase HTATIP/histone acetyltransferase MYST1